MIVFGEVPAPTSVSAGMGSTVYMLILLLVCMYFLIWRPESKRRKAIEAKRVAMKKGDKIVLVGGIIGTFDAMEGSNIIVQLRDGAKMEVLPQAIQDVQSTISTQSPMKPV